jgi:hypothetical protein
MIRVKILAAALYGVASSHCPDAAVNGLRSAIVDTIVPKSTLRSPCLAFEVGSCGEDLDPSIQIFVRRGVEFRRCVGKYPDVLAKVNTIHQFYTDRGYTGTPQASTDLRSLEPAPPHAHAGRTKWRTPFTAMGPIGFLLHDIHCLGAVLDHEWNVCRCAENPISLLEEPWQHLRPCLIAAAKLARSKAAASTRTVIGSCIEIESPVLVRAISAALPENEECIKYIASAGAWSESAKVKSRLAADGRCPHCGAEDQDIVHTIYSCPGLATERASAPGIVGRIDLRDLPPALRIGIPPALGSSLEATFWGCPPANVHTQDDAARQLLGIGLTLPQIHVGALQSSLQHLMAAFLAQLSPDMEDGDATLPPTTDINARRMMDRLRGVQRVDNDMPHIEPCVGPPPAEPNAHSDGSNTQPLWSTYTLGGIGVWRRNRDLNVDALTTFERQHSSHLAGSGSTGLFAPLAGHRMSSARTELFAGIHAVAGPGPIHVAADNLAFANKLTRLITAPADLLRKPWSLQKDGDLWRLMHHVLQAKGPGTVRCSWTKGHVTDSQVAAGTYTALQQQDNDLADTFADLGVLSVGEDLVNLSRMWAMRQGAYCELLVQIHAYIAFMLKADAKRREEKARLNNLGLGSEDTLPIIIVAAALPYAGGGVHLQLAPYIAYTRAAKAIAHRCTAVAEFLNVLLVVPTVDKAHGVSWLELLALFEAMGGSIAIGTAARPPTLGTKITNFKRIFREVVRRCATSAQQEYLKASTGKTARFATIGLLSRVNCLMFDIELQDARAGQVVRAMLTLLSKCTVRARRAHALGELRTRPQKFSLRGVARWQGIIATDHNAAISHPRPQVARDTPRSATEAVHNELRCPACHTPKHVVNLRPKTLGKWAGIWCKACRRAYKASKWDCACTRKWPTCAIHFRWAALLHKPRPAPKPLESLAHPPVAPALNVISRPRSPAMAAYLASSVRAKRFLGSDGPPGPSADAASSVNVRPPDMATAAPPKRRRKRCW